jgi:hypothetical protein
MAYGLTFRLELDDGIPTDPPTFRSAPGVSWKAGDTIAIGRRRLRVLGVRDDHADQPPLPLTARLRVRRGFKLSLVMELDRLAVEECGRQLNRHPEVADVRPPNRTTAARV